VVKTYNKKQKKRLVVKGRELSRNSMENVSSIIRLKSKLRIVEKELHKET
jgi:hypothetical protein